MTIRYIGIDVHSSTCTLAVMSAAGKRIREWQVETDRQCLLEALRSVAGERYVCFEEGTLSDWLYEVLEPVARDIEVIQPLKRNGTKNDSKDAWAAAEAMRVQSKNVVRVFKAPRAFTALRKAARLYELTQRDVVRAKNRIHACYRAQGLQGLNSEIYQPELREQWLQRLPKAHRRLTQELCVQLECLLEVHARAEQWLKAEAEAVPIVQLLSTAPGIGSIRASMIVARVLSPGRFRTRRQFWAYCGLGIVTRSSSDWTVTPTGFVRSTTQQTRGLNRNRQPLLKCVFKGAAMTVIQHCSNEHPLRQAYQQLLTSGRKPNLARLTIARRIAAAVLAMWKTKENYNPAKQQHA